MISEKMEQALNEQVNAEIYSGYLYLSMSAYFGAIGLDGFSHWMRLQAQEELSHGMMIFDYINERGGKINLETIDKPLAHWDSALHVFTDVLAHEQKVTSLINDLVNLALDQRDHASNIFLQWFVAEQVEEEAGVGAVLNKLKLIGDDPGSLFVLDQEMSQRVFTPPAK